MSMTEARVDEEAACPKPKHCYHLVGRVRQDSHGLFRKGFQSPVPAYECCWCGRYDGGGRKVSVEEIQFEPGCQPTERDAHGDA